ncbi:MAG: DoxX family protein [Bacteroidota bacterium]
MEKASLILGLNILLSLIFVFAIYAKLFGVQGPKFTRWGFGKWFIYVVAALELGSILGLYFSGWQVLSLLVQTIIILGALITLSRNREDTNKFFLPFLTLSILIGYFCVLRFF